MDKKRADDPDGTDDDVRERKRSHSEFTDLADVIEQVTLSAVRWRYHNKSRLTDRQPLPVLANGNCFLEANLGLYRGDHTIRDKMVQYSGWHVPLRVKIAKTIAKRVGVDLKPSDDDHDDTHGGQLSTDDTDELKAKIITGVMEHTDMDMIQQYQAQNPLDWYECAAAIADHVIWLYMPNKGVTYENMEVCMTPLIHAAHKDLQTNNDPWLKHSLVAETIKLYTPSGMSYLSGNPTPASTDVVRVLVYKADHWEFYELQDTPENAAATVLHCDEDLEDDDVPVETKPLTREYESMFFNEVPNEVPDDDGVPS